MDTVRVTARRGFRHDGRRVEIGETVAVSALLGAELVTTHKAVYAAEPDAEPAADEAAKKPAKKKAD